jgi:cytoskeletal protein CcmA (bactofilin family)
MADRHASTLIGSGTFVRGRVTGTGDLEIAGRIEGEVTCSGDVRVDGSGLVSASITAHRIVVRGAVKGDLVAEEAVILEAGARVVGDLKAPRIAIAPGALVRGHVQTGGAGAARPRSAAATASRASSTSSTSSAKAAHIPARAEATAKKPAPAAARSASGASGGNGAKSAAHRASGASGASRVGPPPPVVPVLKKGTKAALHSQNKKR